MDKIAKIANILSNDGLVCFPTETVYALAANWQSNKAISKIYNLKQRNKNSPISILVANKQIADSLVHLNDLANKLIDKFCPGPITIIAPKKENIFLPKNINLLNNKIGFRIPDHKISQNILKKIGGIVAATSANISGQKSAVTASEIRQYFDDQIDYILDDEDADIKKASTVVEIFDDHIKILRHGVIEEEDILKALK